MQIHALIPMLVCRDPAAEIAFCQQVLQAVEFSRRVGPDEKVVHATLRLDSALLMIHAEVPTLASAAPAPDGSSGVVIYLYVADVDTIVGRAKAAGARVLLEPRQQAWGDYVARLLDPAGHVWNIAQRDDVRSLGASASSGGAT